MLPTLHASRFPDPAPDVAPHRPRTGRRVGRWVRASGLLSIAALPACAPRAAYRAVEPLPPAAIPAAATLFLLGDGGAPTPGRDSVLAHARREIEAAAAGSSPVVVAYLGDNVYEVGARATHEAEDRAKLSAQIDVLGRRQNVRGLFAPGNHDWGAGSPYEEGRAKLLLEGAWIAELADGRDVGLVPGDGCPGPVAVDVGAALRLVLVDTEALLRDAPPSCPPPEEFDRRLLAALSERGDRRVVVLSHHPLASGGRHGGNVGLFQEFPTISFVAAKTGVYVQDLSAGAYRAMTDRLNGLFERAGAPPLVVASGHEHNLQVIGSPEGEPPWFQLVSGSVAKTSPVGRVDGTRYATDGHGYMRLELRPSGVRLSVFAQAREAGPVGHVFSCELVREGIVGVCPEAPRGARRP